MEKENARYGLLVTVYRPSHDCTAGGVTSSVENIVLVGRSVEGPFMAGHDGKPYLELCRKEIGGDTYTYAVPAGLSERPGMVGPMFGGNFVYSSDSRFRRVCKYPIPVHDRYESPEAYRALSS